MPRMNYIGIYVECKVEIKRVATTIRTCPATACSRHKAQHDSTFNFCVICGSEICSMDSVTTLSSTDTEPIQAKLQHHLSLFVQGGEERQDLTHIWLPDGVTGKGYGALHDEDAIEDDSDQTESAEIDLGKVCGLMETFCGVMVTAGSAALSELYKAYGVGNVSVKFGFVGYHY